MRPNMTPEQVLLAQQMADAKALRMRVKLAEIEQNLEDVKLAVSIMRHDLQSTKRERDSLVSEVRRVTSCNVRFDRKGLARLS